MDGIIDQQISGFEFSRYKNTSDESWRKQMSAIVEKAKINTKTIA